MFIVPDIGHGEGPPEDRNEACVHGDLQLALLADLAGEVWKHVGEHHLVAQSLLWDHEHALAFERLALPARCLRVLQDKGAEFVVVAHFVFAEAFLHFAHGHQADAARMQGLDAFMVVCRERQRGVVGRKRLLVLAEMHIDVTEIVPDAGIVRIES